MRALIVIPDLLDRGPTRFALDLGGVLREVGVQARIFVVRPWMLPNARPVRGRVTVTTGSPPGWRQRYWLPLMSARLLRAVSEADVVIAGNEVGEAVEAAFAGGRLVRRPVGVMAQNNLVASLSAARAWGRGWKRHVQLAERIYPRVDRVVCVSKAVLPTATALGVPSDRVCVIPNGVDVEWVRTLAQYPRPEWLPEGPFLAGLGRLDPSKGFDLLIRAHARALEAKRRHRLVIIGEGQERVRLTELAASLGVSDSVHLPGYLGNPFPVLARASAFCLPSRFEGFALALGEARALGIPMIAADCVAGPNEVLEGGRYGDLVEPESVSALSRGIARHLDDPEPLREKARLAREHAEAVSLARSAAAYAELFEEMTAEPARSE